MRLFVTVDVDEHETAFELEENGKGYACLWIIHKAMTLRDPDLMLGVFFSKTQFTAGPAEVCL